MLVRQGRRRRDDGGCPTMARKSRQAGRSPCCQQGRGVPRRFDPAPRRHFTHKTDTIMKRLFRLIRSWRDTRRRRRCVSMALQHGYKDCCYDRLAEDIYRLIYGKDSPLVDRTPREKDMHKSDSSSPAPF